MINLNSNQNTQKILIEIVKTYWVYCFALLFISISAAYFGIAVDYKIKEIIDQIIADDKASILGLVGLFLAFKFAYHSHFFIKRLLQIRYEQRLTIDICLSIGKNPRGHRGNARRLQHTGW